MDWEKCGFRWMPDGQSVLGGDLLKLYQSIDGIFLKWASEWNAEEFLFPAFIPAKELARIDYFRSFPHLLTFPVTLDATETNLQDFVREPITDDAILLTSTEKVREVLTPAACYHFYIRFAGETLEQPLYLTTCAICFRRESSYTPLQRQWCFRMRELVCIGTPDEVKSFLSQVQSNVKSYLSILQLPIAWIEATDPFFDPSRNPRYLSQRLDPVKTEIVFEDRLAIGSINHHRNFFGDAFRISRAGKDAFSGCVAFGIERWIFALLEHFGSVEEAQHVIDG